MEIDKYLTVVNRYLRDNGLEKHLAKKADIIEYIEPELTDDLTEQMTRLKCRAETIYYYSLFKETFDTNLTFAPEINDVSIKIFSKFKSILGDVKASKLKQYSGEDLLTATRRYTTLIQDVTFFYNEIHQVDNFLDRIGVFLDGGSIWNHYLNERQKQATMPARLRNNGFTDERQISTAITVKIKNDISSIVRAVQVKLANDGGEFGAGELEYCYTKAYIKHKVWTSRKFTYEGDSFYIKYAI